MELLLLYLLFRLIPGGNHYSALTAATLCGLHPLAAETVNYATARGSILSALAVVAGLVTWIVWPRMMPQDFLIPVPKVPMNAWDLRRVRLKPRISRWYRDFLRLPIPWYLIPVGLGMLVSPATVAFVPLLFVYILIFETEKRYLRVLPGVVVCGVIWIGQAIVEHRFGGSVWIPALSYWATQPWVIVRALSAFLWPAWITGVTALQPFPALWSPVALAGYTGVAGLIVLALALSRSREFCAVGFGLWWFLLAMLPSALIPNHLVEDWPRAFLAYAGLAFAITRLIFAYRNAGTAVLVGGAAFAAVVLSLLGVQTSERNAVWLSDETLWADVVARNPGDGRAVLNYGLALMADRSTDAFGIRYQKGLDRLAEAARLLPDDPAVATELGNALWQSGKDEEAEKHLRHAIASSVPYSPAFAAYSRWLLKHQRPAEAFAMAQRAVQLDPGDVEGRRALIDIYLQKSQWADALRVLNEARKIAPEDEEFLREVNVAQSGLDAVRTARADVAKQPSVNNFLALSAIYFREGKLDESLKASQEALKLNAGLVEAWSNIALIYHTQGKPDDAIAALREAVKIRPDLDQFRNNLQYELEHRQDSASR